MKTKITTALAFLTLCSNALFAQWETVYYPLSDAHLPWLNAVEFYNFNKGFTAGYSDGYGYILRTTNNGTDWDTVYTMEGAFVNDVTFADSITIFAVSNLGIAKTNDFGNTWATNSDVGELNAICFPSSHIGYVAGNSGTILKTVNTGTTWDVLSTGVSCTLASVYFINDTVGFACGTDTILKTTNGGLDWIVQSIISETNLGKIFFPSDSIGYCHTIGCGMGSMDLLKTTDQGNTWHLQYTISPFALCYSSLFFTSDNTGYLIGQFTVLKTTDGGITWNTQTASSPAFSNFFDNVMDVYFINQDTGFVVGEGQFYRIPARETSTSSINDNSNKKNNISICPNPSDGNMEFNYTINNSDAGQLKVYDVTGKEIDVYKLNANTNQLQIKLNLTNGIYFYSVVVNDKIVKSDKIVIIK